MRIKVEGLQELLKDLEDNVRPPNSFRSELQKIATFWDKKLETYPKKQAGAFSRLATPRQKKAFWAKVRRGEAQVDGQGYVRTHKLSKAWRWKTLESRRRLIKWYNDVEYSTFVYGNPGQQPFHKASGFGRIDELEREIAQDVEAKLNAYMQNISAGD